MTLGGYLLRQHLARFTIGLSALTGFPLLSDFVKLRHRGLPDGVMIEVLILSIPFVLALTIPGAVLIAVLYTCTQLEKDGQVHALHPGGAGVRQLLPPVLVGALCIAALTLLLLDQVLPRSNHRLAEVLAAAANGPAPSTKIRPKSDREMTIGELRAVVRSARAQADSATSNQWPVVLDEARHRAAIYEVEIQKKYAVAAACLVFALLGAALGLRFQGGGVWLVLGVCLPVFAVCYVGLIAGEDVGDRLILSPFLAMWLPNLILGGIGLLALWRMPRIGTTARPG